MRDDLKKLIDRLPEEELENAENALVELMAKHDPLLRALLDAPEDDEPLTEEERRMIEEAEEDIRQGNVIPAEEIHALYLKKDPCPGN